MRGLLFSAIALLTASTPAWAAWSFRTIEDPLTDAKRGIATVDGPEGGAIVVKCDRNGAGTLYVSIIAPSYLGGTSRDRIRSIKYRADGGQVTEIAGTHDGRTANIFDVAPTRPGGAFLRTLMASQKFVIQVTSFDYRPYTLTFDTEGAQQVIRQSAATCGDTNWTAAP